MSLEIEENVPLAELSTLEIGGPARYFCRCPDTKAVQSALAWAEARQLDVFVLGGGSNVVISDRGFDGLVIRPTWVGVEIQEQTTSALVRAAAGHPWDDLVERSIEARLTGIEALSGIPGMCGAAPIQNIGAYGQELAQTLLSVEAIDRRDGREKVLAAADCGFSYRTSRFKDEWRGRFVITALNLCLPLGTSNKIAYAELARHLGCEGEGRAETRAIRRAVLELRRAKSMVIEPNDPNRRSVGSFFLNPIVSQEQAAEVERRCSSPLPRFPAAGGRVKLSAAWLIERAGFARGHGEGRVGLSTRHSLALVNRGGATAAELVAFSEMIRQGVSDAFAVELEAEAALVGNFEPDCRPNPRKDG